jgi:hypothetical protein
MNFKGTKGKWIAKLGDEQTTSYVHIGNMAIELEINGKHRIEEEKANALLISKAPELLEMLIEAVSQLKGNGFPRLTGKIEQLIKEATEL